MRVSVTSVGLNPLLPKNPATNLPARSFRGLSLCSSCRHSPLSHRERKVGSPVASIPLKSSVSKLTAHVPIVLHLRSVPCASRPRRRSFSSSCLTPLMALGGKQQLYWASSCCLCSHTWRDVGHLGISLYPTEIAVKSWLFSWSPENLI